MMLMMMMMMMMGIIIIVIIIIHLTKLSSFAISVSIKITAFSTFLTSHDPRYTNNFSIHLLAIRRILAPLWKTNLQNYKPCPI